MRSVTARFFRKVLPLVAGTIIAATGDAAAQSPVSAADARDFFGTWSLTLETPDGSLPMLINIGEENGEARVRVGGAEAPSLPDLSKSGENLIGRSQITYQGMDLPMVITISRDGENLRTSWDFGDGLYVTGATATKQQ